MAKTRESRTKRPEKSPTESARAVAVVLYGLLPLVIAGLMAGYLVLSRKAAGEIGFPLDDSWIHTRFAQSLARGEGFSFNPGQPTSTTTAALWTLLYAACHRLTGEFLFTAFATNWLLSVLLCTVVYHLSLTMHPSRWVAVVAAAAVAVTVPLPWWALSGMEPPLYGFLALLAILLHARLRQHAGMCRFLPTVAFALAGLARPECLLLFPLSLIDRVVMARREGDGDRWLTHSAKEIGVHLPVFAAMVVPLFVYNYRVTGYLLPSSFYSKLQWEGVSGALATGRPSTLLYVVFAAPAKELWELVKVWWGNNLVLVVSFVIGLAWMTKDALRAGSKHRSVLIPMVLVAQPVIWALVGGYRPPGFQSQRYLANLNPLFVLLGVIGGAWITERIRARWRTAVRVVLAAAVLLVSLARQPAAARIYAQNVKNITEMQVAIGRWLRDNAPPGSLLAVNDVGAIGVITDNPVLDLQGLVTPEILALRDMKHRLAGTAAEAVSQFIFDRRPDYLVIFPQWYPELDQRRDLFTPVHWVELQDNITSGASLMVVYRTVWAEERRAKEELRP